MPYEKAMRELYTLLRFAADDGYVNVVVLVDGSNIRLQMDDYAIVLSPDATWKLEPVKERVTDV